MVLKTTVLEQGISEATGKSVTMVRYYVARMIAELDLGRHLNKQEASRLNSKVANSFPRNNQGPGYLTDGYDPINENGFPEIIRILQRAKLLGGSR